MDNQTSRIQASTDQIKRLLERAIPNGTVSDVRKWGDWMKYEVICDANKSFLCVSEEFLGDLDETEISKLFEREGVARAIQKNQKGRFVLTRSGLQQGSCGDI
jgi:hypothetical protein